MKVQDTEEAKAKRLALDEWVRVVNQHIGFGNWARDVSFDPRDLEGIGLGWR